MWPPQREPICRAIDTACFNLTDRDERISTVSTARPKPMIERFVCACRRPCRPAPWSNERDHWVVAFAILTGARDGTMPGLRLRHVDLAERVVHFEPRHVHAKFAEIATWFFPVQLLVETLVRDWIELLPDRWTVSRLV